MMKVISRAAGAGAACALLASLATAPAHARTFAEIYAECGLGAILFNSDTSGVENGRAFAIISNVTSDLGTTAILSDATSEEQCAGAPASTASLMLEMLPALERDVARGHGEYLDAVFGAAGCASESRPVLLDGLRAGLATSVSDVPDAAPQVRVAALYDGLSASAASHPGSCAI